MKFGYNITSANTYQVHTGRCYLHAIVFNKPVSGSTVKIIDATSGTSATHGTITNTTAVEPYTHWVGGVLMQNGIRIITSGADDITVVWSSTGID